MFEVGDICIVADKHDIHEDGSYWVGWGHSATAGSKVKILSKDLYYHVKYLEGEGPYLLTFRELRPYEENLPSLKEIGLVN